MALKINYVNSFIIFINIFYIFLHYLFKPILPLNIFLLFSTPITVLITIYNYKNKINKKQLYFILTILVIIIWSSITQNVPIYLLHYAYYSIIFLCIALFMVNNDLEPIIFKFLFFIVSIIFLYFLFIKNINLINKSYLFSMNRSRISAYIISLASFIYIIEYINNKHRPSIYVSLLALLISFKSYARLGTIIAFLLFSIVVFFNINYILKNKISIKQKQLFKIISYVFYVILIIFVSYLIYTNSRLGKVELLNSSNNKRIEIYQSFFKQINIKKAILGFKGENIPENKKHFHNSYLVLWSYSGIFSFVLFAFMLWLLSYYYKTNKFIFSILFLFYIYSFPDWVLFFKGIWDIIFYTLSLKALKD